MTTAARQAIYSRVNKLGDDMARYGPPAPYHQMIEAGSDEDLYLSGLLDRVEDDRAHAEAEKLRKAADEFAKNSSDLVARAMAAATRGAALKIDPYEERDGHLVRKSDGKPITL